MVAIIGLVLETVLLQGLVKNKFRYFRLWYIFTIFSTIASIVLMINFILCILEIPGRPSVGKNLFFDALCVLYYIVIYFVPDYILGPRLTPVLMSIMILVHIFLPIFHGYSFYVVYSYLNSPLELYNRVMRAEGNGASAPSAAMAAANGKNGVNGGAGGGGCGKLCQKCQRSQGVAEMGVNGTRCSSTPLIKPIETTC